MHQLNSLSLSLFSTPPLPYPASKVYIVDLSTSLLAVARERAAERGWDNVVCVEADATTFVPPEGLGAVDLVTFSYSLTMIPDWFAAVEHAKALLRPRGTLGVVDFYVARKWPAAGMRKHSWAFRTFWQIWCARGDARARLVYLLFSQCPNFFFLILSFLPHVPPRSTQVPPGQRLPLARLAAVFAAPLCGSDAGRAAGAVPLRDLHQDAALHFCGPAARDRLTREHCFHEVGRAL